MATLPDPSGKGPGSCIVDREKGPPCASHRSRRGTFYELKGKVDGEIREILLIEKDGGVEVVEVE